MTVTGALHAAMDVLDSHKEALGSGPYCELAVKMKSVAESMNEHAEATRRAFALDLMMDVPACAQADKMFEYTEDSEFMAKVVRRKGLQLQAFQPHVGALMGHAWKIELAEALLPYHNHNPCMLRDVRYGVLTLLELRSGFLSQITNHLIRKGITPQMLCPLDHQTRPREGDDGSGPRAKQFLAYEPRMLRWLLEIGELEPWPLILPGAQPFYASELIAFANKQGGDDRRVNEPCSCQACLGVRIPTLECAAAALVHPECDLPACDESVP
jgi:hypothetical protein